METLYLVELVAFKVEEKCIFSLQDPHDLESLLKDSEGVPYQLEVDAHGSFSLKGGGEIPDEGDLKELLKEDFTNVVIIAH
ncbi:MAG: hypothetical protein WD509_00990 [Candidatus Paceibacterota bacterium]